MSAPVTNSSSRPLPKWVFHVVKSAHGQRSGVNTDRITLESDVKQVRKPPRCLQGPRFARTSVKSQVLHTNTVSLCRLLRGTPVNHLPLAYKGWGRSPSHGHRFFTTSARSHALIIGTPPQSPSRDMEDPPPLPPSL
jgi:hypothetical protein